MLPLELKVPAPHVTSVTLTLGMMPRRAVVEVVKGGIRSVVYDGQDLEEAGRIEREWLAKIGAI